MSESGRYWLRQTGWSALSSVPMALLAAAYLADVLELSPEGWRRFLWIVAALTPPTFLASSMQQRRRAAPVLAWMDEGPSTDPAKNRETFRQIMGLPRMLVRFGVLGWMGGGTLAALAALVMIPEYGVGECVATILTCFGASLFSAFFTYLISRGELRASQQEAAAHVSLADRGAAVATVPLTTKLLLAFVSTGVVPLALCAILVWSAGDSAAEIKSRLPLVTALAALFAACLAWLFARDLTRTLSDLSRAVDRLAQGDLRDPIRVDSDDEVGELARACGRMSEGLTDAVRRMAAAAERIEDATATLEVVGNEVGEATAAQQSGAAEAVASFETIESEVRDLSQRSDQLANIAESSSSATIELKASGEEVQEMSTRLFEQIDQAVPALGQIAESATSITTQVQDLATLAADAHTDTDRLASAASEIDREAEETGRLAQLVTESSDTGRDRVLRTGEGMRTIQTAVTAGEKAIEALRGDVAEINTVLRLIDDVAAETHLLSLNAAIIAAQAGEHGRGFAVVAEEVKELAQTVTRRIQEIAGIIESVESGTQHASVAMSESRVAVDRGLELSAEAEGALDEIAESARHSGSRVREILRSLREQSAASVSIRERIESVSSGMGTIESAASEQVRSHGEVLRAAESIREVAQMVQSSTEEQARGTETIRTTLVSLDETAQTINSALGNQSQACSGSLSTMRTLNEGANRNQAAVLQLVDSLASLRLEAEALNAEVDRFDLAEAGAD
ncbi:MAG: methyl-accepting chemotaxis protein [Myxococcota bacterium]|nr:methyl-accepting chemotaxis protein [Myxococcota bacterium]